MPKYEITPADSPDVQCEFVIPRTGKTPIEFSVPRVEYTADFEERWTKWLGTRMKASEDGADPAPIGDKEAVVEQLRVAGVSAAVCKQLYTLTPGELNQIFTVWTSASKVTVGESEASAN